MLVMIAAQSNKEPSLHVLECNQSGAHNRRKRGQKVNEGMDAAASSSNEKH